MANIESFTKTPLLYTSSTKKLRPAILFLSLMLTATAIAALLLIISSIATLMVPHGTSSIPVLALVAGCAFLGYSLWYGARLWSEAKRQHRLILDDHHVELTYIEATGHQYAVQMAISEIDFVEHFTVRDREAIIFHGKDGRTIEAPLWDVEEDIQPALHFLRHLSVKVVQV